MSREMQDDGLHLSGENTQDLERRYGHTFLALKLTLNEMRPSLDIMINHAKPTQSEGLASSSHTTQKG